MSMIFCRRNSLFRRRSAVAALLATGWLAAGAGAGAFALELGEQVPPIVADDWTGGDAVNPAEPGGETVYLIDFWFASCSPCVETVPILNGLQEKYADRGLVVVGVNIADSADDIAKYREEHGIVFRTARDRAGDLPGPTTTTLAYHSPLPPGRQAIGYPSAFVVDREGYLLWKGNPLGGIGDAVAAIMDGSWTRTQAKQAGEAEAQWTRGQQNENPTLMYQAARTLAALQPDNPVHYQRWYMTAAAAGYPDDIDAALDGWFRASAGRLDSFVALAEFANDGEDFDRRRPQLSAGALLEASKLAGDDARANFQVAIGYLKMGMRDRAAENLERALDLADDNVMLILAGAQIFSTLGDPDRAIALLTEKGAAEGPAKDVFDSHRAYYEKLADVKRHLDRTYTPTAEAAPLPSFPSLSPALPEPMGEQADGPVE